MKATSRDTRSNFATTTGQLPQPSGTTFWEERLLEVATGGSGNAQAMWALRTEPGLYRITRSSQRRSGLCSSSACPVSYDPEIIVRERKAARQCCDLNRAACGVSVTVVEERPVCGVVDNAVIGISGSRSDAEGGGV